MFYVYVLQDSVTKKLYIGFSGNLKQHIATHKSGGVNSTKTGSYSLIYYEAYIHKQDALGREKFLKGGSGRKYINKQLTNYFSEIAANGFFYD